MIRRIISAAVMIAIALTFCLKAKAEDQPTLVKMRATAYPDTGNPTKSGTMPHYGTAGGRTDMIGKTIIMYQRLPNGEVGEIIGIFEVKDTGCKDSVIDVWMPDLEECQKWMDKLYEDGCQGKVFCEVIEADG